MFNKKILIVVPDVNFIGGAERVAINLHHLFKNNSIDVKIFSLFSTVVDKSKLGELSVIHGGYSRSKSILSRINLNIRNFPRINRILKQYDYVIGNNVFRYYLLPIYQSKLIEIQHLRYEEEVGSKLNIRNFFYKMLYKVVTLTERDRIEFESNDVKNITCIPNFIPDISLSNQYKASSKMLLAVGRLTSQKNFISLINIWNEIDKKFINDGWKLVIVGEGEQRSEVESLVKLYNLSSSVELIGEVNDTNGYFKNASILVSTSLYEGFPLVLLEALNASLPIVSYNYFSGASELIDNNKNGFLAPLNNEREFKVCLEKLMGDQILRASFSKYSFEKRLSYEASFIFRDWMSKVLNETD